MLRAGADRAHGHVEGQGRLVVAQPGPVHQQQGVAVGGPQPGQGGREGAPLAGRGDPRDDLVGGRLDGGVDADPGQRPVEPDLGLPVAADHVGGDAEQPRTRVAVGQVVAVPAAEGHQEGLADHILGRAGPEPPGGVAVDIGGMPVEDGGERLRLGPGTRDQRRVVGPGVRIRRRAVPAERGGLVHAGPFRRPRSGEDTPVLLRNPGPSSRSAAGRGRLRNFPAYNSQRKKRRAAKPKTTA